MAVSEDDDVTSNRTVRQMEDRIRELERQLGRKTLEAEILPRLWTRHAQKTDLARAVASQGRFPEMVVVAQTLGVARSNLIDRLHGRAKPRRRKRRKTRRWCR